MTVTPWLMDGYAIWSQGVLLPVLGAKPLCGAVWRVVFENVGFYGYVGKRAVWRG